MSDLARFYRPKLPLYFIVFALVGTAMAAGIFGAGIFSVISVRPAITGDLNQLGLQGDFFGGHFSAIVGLLTLLVVGAAFFIERQESRRFALREQFAQAISLIVSSFEQSEEENAKPSIMTYRLVNYYARVALAHPEDKELLIMLNVPITGTLRRELEAMIKDKDNKYPFACKALADFKVYEESIHLDRKGIKR
jgi:hypothetical protein